MMKKVLFVLGAGAVLAAGPLAGTGNAYEIKIGSLVNCMDECICITHEDPPGFVEFCTLSSAAGTHSGE